MTVNPKIEKLNDPEELRNGVLSIIKENSPVSDTEILRQIKEQIEVVDFKILAYPEIEKLRAKRNELEPDSEEAKQLNKRTEKFKLNAKHYSVLTIEQLLKIAKENSLGLCKNQDFIYLFNRYYWLIINKDTFQVFLGEVAEKMGVDNISAKHYQFREHLYKQFLTA
ncbi:MAG: DNA primase, partial [Bacteroidota bacterium]